LPNDLKRDFDLLNKLIGNLLEKSATLWRRKLLDFGGKEISDDTKDTYYSLIDIKYPLSEGEFKKFVEETTKRGNFQIELDRLYLPPLEDEGEFIPILALSCDLKSPHGSISFRIRLIRGDTKKKPLTFQGIGYRFELGHSTSTHSYYHVQFTNLADESDPKWQLPGCPVWIPTLIPRILTPARNPVSLILCILLSLYGKIEFVDKLVSGIRADKRYFELIKSCTHASESP